MAQQMTLLFAVPLGLLAGRPDELARGLWSRRPAAIGTPALAGAWLGFVGVQWVVHMPAVLDLTLNQPAGRAGAHWALVAAGVAFFGCALGAVSSGRLHPLAVGLYVVSMMPVTDAFGLWLMFDPHVIYAEYAGPGAIGDQQRAGAVMFAAGTVPMLVAVGVTYAWASRDRVSRGRVTPERRSTRPAG
jgi:cytochrome c oxidase assembly factor CtaG